MLKRFLCILLVASTLFWVACAEKEPPPVPASPSAPPAVSAPAPTGDSTLAGRDAVLPSEVPADCRTPSGKLRLQSVPFDLDQSELTPAAQRVLDRNAKCLAAAPAVHIVLEGHCDERGTTEYNLTLGEQRASSVAKYLDRLGIDRNRLRLVSKGKNEPICTESTDACWAKNRRVELE